jgi:hypothetical protein
MRRVRINLSLGRENIASLALISVPLMIEDLFTKREVEMLEHRVVKVRGP